jgi:hypothetical protein
MSLFCRHNRFTADCPICSKGTVLDSSRPAERRRPAKSAGGGARSGRRGSAGDAPRQFSGPHVTAGPYERDDDRYEVRLEKVPGGVRLAQWSRGSLERRPPELPAADLRGLVAAALERELLDARDAEALRGAVGAADPAPEDGGSAPASPSGDGAAFGASPGRAGDMREELRVERLGDGRLRIGRWLFWPGRGWELQEAPPMLPAKRYAQALREAAARNLLDP